MTRDEAYEVCRHFWGTGAMDAIDAWVKLGMLKLDEPKNADDRIAAVVMSTFSFDTNAKEMALFRKELKAAGLQIIEKGQ